MNDEIARATQDVRDGLHCDLAAMQTPQQQDQAVNDTLARLEQGWRLVPPGDHHQATGRRPILMYDGEPR